MTFKQLRIKAGLTKKDIQRASGVSVQTIWRFETGERVAIRSARAIIQPVSDALGVPINYHELDGARVYIK